MGRNKRIFTEEYPYHVYVRSNNKEWFYLETSEVWEIFVQQINQILKKYNALAHAFVLMSNHYHLILSTSKDYNLGIVMQEIQKSVSRIINHKAGRINHVFGGPYKASLIRSEEHYADILKYIYRNPVRARISSTVQGYAFSSLNDERFLICSHAIFGRKIPKDLVLWLNLEEDEIKNKSIKKGLKRSLFKPTYDRKY
ncbi:transposase [bacterium]|nr:transposase [bacterium]